MKKIYNLLPFTLLILALFSFTKWEQALKPRVLVFSKTAAYRHESIAAGKTALIKLGKENGFTVDTTENENYFNDDSLKNYSAVIFLSTTGNILNSPQQISFERFIQSGGAYVGIHAAADTEYDWEWYGKLAGGYFKSHPKIQDATMIVKDRTHLSTKHLDENWVHKDEWYNYKNLNPDVNVLISLDEKSYTGGENGDNHPIFGILATMVIVPLYYKFFTKQIEESQMYVDYYSKFLEILGTIEEVKTLEVSDNIKDSKIIKTLVDLQELSLDVSEIGQIVSFCKKNSKTKERVPFVEWGILPKNDAKFTVTSDKIFVDSKTFLSSNDEKSGILKVEIQIKNIPRTINPKIIPIKVRLIECLLIKNIVSFHPLRTPLSISL
jgi:hypothetical protein